MSDLTEAIEWWDAQGWHYMTEPRIVLLVEAARLVASGEVVAKTDLPTIQWCLEHEAAVPYQWAECDARWRKFGDCEIVSAGLHLEGETE